MEMPEFVKICTRIRDGLPCRSVLSIIASGEGEHTWCYRCGATDGPHVLYEKVD